MKKSIKCPRCEKAVKYSPENEYRPFCSQRCWLIDLGEWIEGKYKINTEENYQTFEYPQEEFNTKH